MTRSLALRSWRSAPAVCHLSSRRSAGSLIAAALLVGSHSLTLWRCFSSSSNLATTVVRRAASPQSGAKTAESDTLILGIDGTLYSASCGFSNHRAEQVTHILLCLNAWALFLWRRHASLERINQKISLDSERLDHCRSRRTLAKTAPSGGTWPVFGRTLRVR